MRASSGEPALTATVSGQLRTFITPFPSIIALSQPTHVGSAPASSTRCSPLSCHGRTTFFSATHSSTISAPYSSAASALRAAFDVAHIVLDARATLTNAAPVQSIDSVKT